jgi:hypothetical protein
LKIFVLGSVFLLAVCVFFPSGLFSTSSTTVKVFVREPDGKPVADAKSIWAEHCLKAKPESPRTVR